MVTHLKNHQRGFQPHDFPGEKFVGIVDEVSETSKDTSVVFSISDKREVKDFTIKVKYDTELYKEFKNGMSAKLKVYNK